ncbi:small multi-drug export protein [Nocardiopsis salina]|uniref:small multi-drug export protein n=1 Tax=Nocardiopsis salina TaxID=245836 RepID=UPI0003480C80|nr:small multi-drug export protein [Nocardiopsis salina]
MNDFIAHLLVLLGAAVPWVELLAVPPAIALGLSPVTVGITAFLSNTAVSFAAITGSARLLAWWERRRGRPIGSGATGQRGRKAFERFGVPGLALQGPFLSGMYFAVLFAVLLGAPRNSVMLWTVVSNALWTVALAVGTIAGVGFLT